MYQPTSLNGNLDTVMHIKSDKLVTTTWLAENIDDPDLRVIEISRDPEGQTYSKGHIPNAVFWFWKKQLWHTTNREFASPTEISRSLAEMGTTERSKIVIYGDPIQYGTYGLWVLAMAGFNNISILDGGRTKWIAEGRSLSREIPRYETTTPIINRANSIARIGRDEVLKGLTDAKRVLIDARSPEEYMGERVSPPGGFDHGAERVGRIPGSKHLFFRDILNEDDTFISAEKLIEKVGPLGITDSLSNDVVTYCRLSHRATIMWFALTHILDISNVKVYDGSWTEWGSIVGFPIEKNSCDKASE